MGAKGFAAQRVERRHKWSDNYAGTVSTARPAAVIGSGPNGLAAAVTLARAGVPVTVFEAAETAGGGARTERFVDSGYLHDVCSSIHPMALASGFFRAFELDKRMSFHIPDVSYANPLDGTAAIAYRDLVMAATELGRDANSYLNFYGPLTRRIEGVLDFAIGGSMLRWPRQLSAAFVTAARTVEQGSFLWNARFREELAPALISGVAAHSIGKMPNLASSAVGVVLATLGHTSGWPVPLGGSQAITNALIDDLVAHGGRIETSHEITDFSELSDFGVTLFDTSARGLAVIAGDKLPHRYRSALGRFRYGNAASKVDFVLDGPIPWADARVAQAPTVHVCGTRADIEQAENEVSRGHHPERPYVLLTQAAAFDPGRNPSGVNVVGSYTHVPAGSTTDVSERVTAQISRFAPGFRDRIVSVHVTTAAQLAQSNRNYVEGDFNAGALNLKQVLARPVFSSQPWRTPTPGMYLASSSTPPGPGVHGLSGWYAAKAALSHEYGLPAPYLGVNDV